MATPPPSPTNPPILNNIADDLLRFDISDSAHDLSSTGRDSLFTPAKTATPAQSPLNAIEDFDSPEITRRIRRSKKSKTASKFDSESDDDQSSLPTISVNKIAVVGIARSTSSESRTKEIKQYGKKAMKGKGSQN